MSWLAGHQAGLSIPTLLNQTVEAMASQEAELLEAIATDGGLVLWDDRKSLRRQFSSHAAVHAHSRCSQRSDTGFPAGHAAAGRASRIS